MEESRPRVNLSMDFESPQRHGIPNIIDGLWVVRVNGLKVHWGRSLSTAVAAETIVRRTLEASGVEWIAGVFTA